MEDKYEEGKPVVVPDDRVNGSDYYEISNLGHIRNAKTKRVRKPKPNSEGYYYLNLKHKGLTKGVTVGRAVALTFIPNPLGLPQVDHINRDKSDNRVENLRWVNPKENAGNRVYSNKSSKRPVVQYDLDGNYIAEFDGCGNASTKTGINAASIYKVANKGVHRKTAGGYIWRYKDEGIE